MDRSTATATISALNEFLRDELATIAAYDEVMPRMRDAGLTAPLLECQRAHRASAAKLRDRITSVGGTPHLDRATRGEQAAPVVAPAIGALEAHETLRIQRYVDGLPNLDGPSRAFVERELLPEQRLTRGLLHTVKLALN